MHPAENPTDADERAPIAWDASTAIKRHGSCNGRARILRNRMRHLATLPAGTALRMATGATTNIIRVVVVRYAPVLVSSVNSPSTGPTHRRRRRSRVVGRPLRLLCLSRTNYLANAHRCGQYCYDSNHRLPLPKQNSRTADISKWNVAH